MREATHPSGWGLDGVRDLHSEIGLPVGGTRPGCMASLDGQDKQNSWIVRRHRSITGGNWLPVWSVQIPSEKCRLNAGRLGIAMKNEWLDETITVEEVETNYAVRHEELESDPVPFGSQNQDWLAFKEQMVDGDELRLFYSSFELWLNMSGCAGIAMVKSSAGLLQ